MPKKTLILSMVVLAGFALALWGCNELVPDDTGGGSGGSVSETETTSESETTVTITDTNTPPHIGSLEYPTTLRRGRTYTVGATYVDPEGDITGGHYEVTYNGNTEGVDFTAEEVGISGQEGVLSYTGEVPATVAKGQYALRGWLVDARGNRSNEVSAVVNLVD